MRVVGVGLNKTGTKTLGIALGHLGLTRRLSFDAEAFRLWRQGDLAPLLAAVGRAQVAEDWPWPLLFREIDAAFPGTRFLLTRRSDAATWYRSLCHHADRTGPTEFRAAIYGHAMPQGHEAEHIAIYERHNAEVRAWFRDRPDQLLEIAWEDREGWDPLCAFLGRPVPATPFPWANADPMRKAG